MSLLPGQHRPRHHRGVMHPRRHQRPQLSDPPPARPLRPGPWEPRRHPDRPPLQAHEQGGDGFLPRGVPGRLAHVGLG